MDKLIPHSGNRLPLNFFPLLFYIGKYPFCGFAYYFQAPYNSSFLILIGNKGLERINFLHRSNNVAAFIQNVS
ncbi:MAG: hypothetical protein SH857_06315 [Chitinophagales bacterium]|nr:hypothetical protein [Chitinophagales bacterium]